MLYGRPEFESRLGNPEEAFHRADAVKITGVVYMRITRVVYIIILCLLD
jgi:hypothetical protein